MRHIPKKREGPNKRHDQDSKVASKCDGWLHLTLSDLSDLLSFFSRVSKNVKNTCVCGSAPLRNPLCSFRPAERVSHGHELRWRSPWLSSWILSTLLDDSVPFGTGATDCTPRTVGTIAILEWHSRWLQNESISKFSMWQKLDQYQAVFTIILPVVWNVVYHWTITTEEVAAANFPDSCSVWYAHIIFIRATKEEEGTR